MSISNIERNEGYRRELKLNLKYGNISEHSFHLANLSLDELKQRINAANEPTESDFDHVRHRFEHAIVVAEDEGAVVDSLRAQLMLAYVKPIALADVVNKPSLGKSEAKKSLRHLV